MSESKSEPSSPMKSHHRILSKSVENEMQEQTERGEKKTKTSRGVHKRCKTMPPNQVHKIHRPITIDPDRFLKTKFAAEQALRVSNQLLLQVKNYLREETLTGIKTLRFVLIGAFPNLQNFPLLT